MKIQTIGNKKILENTKLALFCSRKCPPDLIVKSLDLAVQLRQQQITVISGFQSLVEKEILDILLKGKQNIIWAHSRNIEGMKRIPAKIKPGIDKGRFLIISNFDESENRPSQKRGLMRNYYIAEQANEILILHATPGSSIEKLALSFRNSEKKLFTIASKWNENLIEMGFTNFLF